MENDREGAYVDCRRLLSKEGTLSVEAIEAMQTTLPEYKAQDKRVPTEDLYTTEFTPVRL